MRASLVCEMFLLIAHFAAHNREGAALAQDVQQISYKYAVIVDCGSSGSRAHIFRWSSGPDGSTAAQLENLEPMRDPSTGEPLIKRVTPGLASLHERPELASAYMKPIMDFVSAKIPRESQRDTPIYFMATAGLRLLTRKERKELLDDIARDLKLEYNFPDIHTRVISGPQEGLYEWFSINAHAKRLLSTSDTSFHCKAPMSRRYGLTEMGGASVQVTFEVTPELDRFLAGQLRSLPAALKSYRDSHIEVNLDSENNKKVKLFSTTFLGLGSNSARDLAIDLLIRRSLSGPASSNILAQANQVAKIELDDPCLPIGATESTRRTLNILTDRSRSINYHIPDPGEPGLNVRLNGIGNMRRCLSLLVEMLSLARSEQLNCHDNEESSAESCSMSLLGSPFVPFRFVQFLGLGDFYHTTNEMIHAPGRFNIVLIKARAAIICATPYDVLLSRYPEADRVDSKRVLHECFKANWILTFLIHGLRLNLRTSANLETVNKINGKDIDWTFGAMAVKVLDEFTSVL